MHTYKHTSMYALTHVHTHTHTYRNTHTHTCRHTNILFLSMCFDRTHLQLSEKVSVSSGTVPATMRSLLSSPSKFPHKPGKQCTHSKSQHYNSHLYLFHFFVCVCVCVCVCVHVHPHLCISKRDCVFCVCEHICKHMCTLACVSMFTSLGVCMCVYVCMCVCVCVCLSLSLCLSVHLSVCLCVPMYVCTFSVSEISSSCMHDDVQEITPQFDDNFSSCGQQNLNTKQCDNHLYKSNLSPWQPILLWTSNNMST